MTSFSKHFILFFFLPYWLIVSSCRNVYPNTLFQNENYVPIAPKIEAIKDAYVIKEGDELSIKVYSRNGMNLVDVLKESNVNVNTTTFLVDMNGMADLPVIGYYKVSGFKEAELKAKLEHEYEKLYNDPFVNLKIENRRAFVFKGSQGSIVALNKAPTNLIEVLAKAGGIDRTLKAYNIKIIRGNLKNPEVYQVDLSTMKGMTTADLTIQTNDIVYVEEFKRPVYHAIVDVAPIITLPLSMATLIVALISNLKR